MKREHRVRILWLALSAVGLLAAVLTPLLVTAGTAQIGFTATLYADVVRFEASGVASLRVTIYDLAENELWSSGQVSSDFVDWDRTNERGERLANGYYLYLAQGWDATGRLVLNKAGKVVLLPGDQVELRSAPVAGALGDPFGDVDSGSLITTMGLGDTGIFGAVGIGIDPPPHPLSVREVNTDVSGNVNAASMYLDGNPTATSAANYYAQNLKARTEDGGTQDYTGTLAGIMLQSTHRGSGTVDDLYGANFVATLTGTGTINTAAAARYAVKDQGGTIGQGYGILIDQVDGTSAFGVYVDVPASNYFQGNVGIGTTTPGQKLDVAGDIELNGVLYMGADQFLRNTGIANTFLGVSAGSPSPTGERNTAIGYGTLISEAGGGANTAIGYEALTSLTSASSNTAVGHWAMRETLTGIQNIAVGSHSLSSNTTGSLNVAVGGCALLFNVSGGQNTAVGKDALYHLTAGQGNAAFGAYAGDLLENGDYNIYIGHPGLATESNTVRIGNSTDHSAAFMAGIRGVTVAGPEYVVIDANGQLGSTASTGGSGYWTASGSDIYSSNTGNAGIGTTSPSQKLDVDGNIEMNGRLYMGSSLFMHDFGTDSTFLGVGAGNLTMTGYSNTAVGTDAMAAITEGFENTAVGKHALASNTGGDWNVAIGKNALGGNTTGRCNTAVGNRALEWAPDGFSNTAIGTFALISLGSGEFNTALGGLSGGSLANGSYNIYIGNAGQVTESNTIRIGDDMHQSSTYVAGIDGTTVSGGTAVYIKSDGQLGTTTSSARFKTGIADLGLRSDVLYDLRPVTFQYKPEIDPDGILQYGLIAEEVAEVAPDLVIYEDNGDPYTVRYEQLVPLLLNELQRLHDRVAALESEIAELE